ncbi:MAG: hypothetical protein ACOCQR_02390 [bacterium]
MTDFRDSTEKLAFAQKQLGYNARKEICSVILSQEDKFSKEKIKEIMYQWIDENIDIALEVLLTDSLIVKHEHTEHYKVYE